MPKDISQQQQQIRTRIQNLQGQPGEAEGRRRQLLEQNRDLVYSRDKDAIEATFKAQKNNLDRLFAVLYHSTKQLLCRDHQTKHLSLDQKLEMGAAPNVINGPDEMLICGLSMGGFGAFKLALRFPEKFSHAASLRWIRRKSESTTSCLPSPSASWRWI